VAQCTTQPNRIIRIRGIAPFLSSLGQNRGSQPACANQTRRSMHVESLFDLRQLQTIRARRMGKGSGRTGRIRRVRRGSKSKPVKPLSRSRTYDVPALNSMLLTPLLSVDCGMAAASYTTRVSADEYLHRLPSSSTASLVTSLSPTLVNNSHLSVHHSSSGSPPVPPIFSTLWS
jgi:hypothetical protein